MLKKILIAVGSLIAAILVLVIAAGIFLMAKVDKAFIESQMGRILYRQVHIEKIDAGIFSIVSGIEVKNIAISNFKTPEQLTALAGKPVPAGDIFADVDSVRFKIMIMPLLHKEIVIKELVFYNPVINLTRNKENVLNCDDLMKSKKPNPADKAEAKKTKEAEVKKEAKPLTADDLPVAIVVGEIGVKNGTINYYDGKFDQRFQLYKLTALAYDINIDPKDLEKKNEIKLKLGMGLKTVGPMKTGSVQNFDITIEAPGKVVPFDVKTRELTPEIIVHVGFPEGQITGLQIFNAVAAVPVIGDYLGEHISFLKGKQEWKGSRAAGADLRYKAAKAEISNGKLDLKEANLLFRGAMHTESKALDMTLDMVMKKEINAGVKKGLVQKLDQAIKSPDVKKYTDSDKLALTIMQPLLNKDGMIDLKFKVGGTTRKTDVKLIQPQLSDLNSVIKKSVAGLATEAGKTAGKQLLEEGRKKVIGDVQNLFKK